MTKFKFALLSSALLVSGVAMAQEVARTDDTILKATAIKPAAVSVELGTFGYGANVSWSANKTTEVVAGWSGGSFDADTDIGGSDSIINWKKVLGDEWKDAEGKLALKADFNNPYVGVKVRPFANRFTVGTGVILQDNEIDVGVTANKDYSMTVNGKEYTVTGSGKVNVRAENKNKLAPYVTIGFKPNDDRRFGMFGELGAVYTGDWRTSVTAVDADGNPIQGANGQNLQDELKNKIEDDNIAWYPIIKLGATVRF